MLWSVSDVSMHTWGDAIELKVLGKISKPLDTQKTERFGTNNPTGMVVRGVHSLSDDDGN